MEVTKRTAIEMYVYIFTRLASRTHVSSFFLGHVVNAKITEVLRQREGTIVGRVAGRLCMNPFPLTVSTR